MTIPKIDTKNKKLFDKIINKVDEIFKIKNEIFNADVSKIEREIDNLVYRLYNINDNEINIVEGEIK